MYSNYKFISYEKLIEEVDKNNDIQIHICKYNHKYVVPNYNHDILNHNQIIPNKNISSHEDEYFKDNKNPWIGTMFFQQKLSLINNYNNSNNVDFIFLLENNLIYKHNDKPDNWKDEPKIQLYMHNKELFNKIYK